MTVCSVCRSTRPTQPCEICGEPTCKNCQEFLSQEELAFRSELPEELKKTRYCQRCFDQHVAPARQEYAETLERAKEVVFIPKTYRGHVQVLRKSMQPISIQDRPDRKELILMMAFRAAEQGFNAILQIEIENRKVRNHAYQKTLYSGRGLPAEVDEKKIRDHHGLLEFDE